MDHFHLFLSLPIGAQWYILDHLSLVEVWIFRSLSRITKNICSEGYFQRRASNLGAKMYIDKGRIFIDKYVMSIVDSNIIDLEPDVIFYISKSHDLLFPGIEHFIGLRQMAIRAIMLRSSEYLTHVLRSNPDTETESVIFGSLSSLSDDPLKSLLMSGEHVMTYRGSGHIYVDCEYYPSTSSQCKDYRAGVAGQKLSTYDIISYLLGLIDGKHDDLFIQEYENLIMTFTLIEMDMITKHVAARGSVNMVNGLRMPKTVVIDYAIKHDNVTVVESCLSEGLRPRSRTRLDLIVYPGSVAMLKLLRSYHIPVPDESILIGAAKTGNYDLLSYLNRVPTEIFDEVMTEVSHLSVPTYMHERIKHVNRTSLHPK